MFDIGLHLWLLDPSDHLLPDLRRLLSEDERARAARFVRPLDRDRYITGRARLRQILAAATGRDPRALRFSYGAHGKPALKGGPAFNLSHSGPLAALAIGPAATPAIGIGIDIERIRPIEAAVARRHFSPAEHAALGQMPAADWLTGFYRCWTRKEALVKAQGTGLSMPLDSFDVSLTDNARLERIDGDSPGNWRMIHFNPAPGWVGAVAARTGGQEIALSLRETGTPPLPFG